MFDISNMQSVRTNPILAKGIVKYLSVYELMMLAKECCKNGVFILKDENIVNGILESQDDGKILFLASSGKLDDFAKSDRFVEIYNKGEIFKSALFGNSQIDWYALFIWNHSILDIILSDVLPEDSKLKLPFYKNPRMDRRLIARIIKAKAYDTSKHTFDFSQINLDERYKAITYSFDVNEIKSEDYYGKDAPDNNELYFKDPFNAVIVFVKDLFNKWESEAAECEYYGVNLIYHIDYVELGLDYEDWLSEEEQDQLKEKYSDFSFRYDILNKVALNNVFTFFDNKTLGVKSIEVGRKDWSEEGLDLFKYYSKVCLPITIIPKLLMTYRYKNDVGNYLPKLVNSDNWVIRAAGYSYLFQNITKMDVVANLRKLIQRYEHDKVTLVWGIFATSHHYLLIKVNDEAMGLLRELFDSIGFNESMNKFFQDIGEFIYGTRYEDMTYESIEKIMRDRRLHRSNTNLEPFIDPGLKSKESVGYQIGKTVGKFFK